MLTIPHCKESLSRAYVTAVVGRARHNLIWGREYDYGRDGTIKQLARRGSRITETGFGIDFQSKSTVDWHSDSGHIVYDLGVEAYNDLADRSATGSYPFILILLCLPHSENMWLDVSANRLVLQHCAYWHTISGAPTNNSGTCRIRIPENNVLTPEVIEDMLCAAGTGRFWP